MDYNSARPNSPKNTNRHTIRQEETETACKSCLPPSSPTGFFPHTNHKRGLSSIINEPEGAPDTILTKNESLLIFTSIKSILVIY